MSKDLTHSDSYATLLADIAEVIQSSHQQVAQSVNAAMTATYWLIGHHIVEFEQQGADLADYGKAVVDRLAADLSQRYKRGFSARNLRNMRLFYLAYRDLWQSLPAELQLSDISEKFKLPWRTPTSPATKKSRQPARFYVASRTFAVISP